MMRWLALLLVLCSCGDPLNDNKIAALGDEQEGFPPSDVHRPGQPCVLCHSQYGGAEPELSIGGTLFLEPEGSEVPRPVAGYTIRIIDSASQIVNLVSNRCGNFYITKSDFDPAYPLRAELFGPSIADAEKTVQLTVMSTRIGRDGSCGSCHSHPASVFSPGVVYLPSALVNPDVEFPDPASCPLPRFAPQL